MQGSAGETAQSADERAAHSTYSEKRKSDVGAYHRRNINPDARRCIYCNLSALHGGDLQRLACKVGRQYDARDDMVAKQRNQLILALWLSSVSTVPSGSIVNASSVNDHAAAHDLSGAVNTNKNASNERVPAFALAGATVTASNLATCLFMRIPSRHASTHRLYDLYEYDRGTGACDCAAHWLRRFSARADYGGATPAQLRRDAVSIDVQHRALRDTVIEKRVRRVAERGYSTVNVLILSGGGQSGAFGVGFLRGWQQRTTDPMPRFDLVTGISTGSLQAPYALLGTPSAIDTITALYARAAPRFAPSLDWKFLLRPTGGVVNTKRFDRTIADTFGGPLRDQLQTAFAKDQLLVFGTTDYDLGIGRVWSLGETLGSNKSSAAAERTQRLLKAATAIPGIFPSVMIDGHLQGDGGVIENILLLLTFEDYTRLGQRLQARGLTDVTVRVWVIMNL